MKPKHILFGMLALFAASCANDEMNEVAALKQNGIQVTAGLTANTRVNFEQDGNVTHALWEEGDQITLYAPSQGYFTYQVSTLSEDATSATFTPVYDALQNTDETIYAAYTPDMAPDIVEGFATLPITDSWIGEHPMPFAYAISNVADGKINLSFQHIFAYLKLTLNAETVASSTNKSVAVIGVSTTSDEPLANVYGYFNIPEQEYVIEKGSNHMYFTLEEAFTATGTAEKSVYIPILPQPAGETITINIFGDYEAADTLFTESKEVPSTGFLAGRAYTFSPKSSITRVGNTVTLTEAGTLSKAISATEKDTITSLKIIGPLNGDDIRFIIEMAGRDIDENATKGKLKHLDIGEAWIVEGGDAYFVDYDGNQHFTSDDVIGDCMFWRCFLKSIVLPNDVTSIGNSAFYDCSSLASITIPDGVTSIGNEAFKNCIPLISIDIPNSVTSIGNGAFSSCTGLTSVNMGSGVTSIGESAFIGCEALTSITIPASVVEINGYAFLGCEALTEVTCNAATPPSLGSNVFIASPATLYVPSGTYSAYMASDWASYFTTIDDGEEHGSYENGVATVVTAGTLSSLIPEDEKYTITTLKVVGPLNGDDIRFIREMAGRDVNDNETDGQLVDLDLSEASIVEGGGGYFYHLDTKYYYTTDNVIGYSMFRLTILETIFFPKNVTSIGNSAFYGCSSLASINIPDGVTEVGDRAFYECSSLVSAIVGSGVTSIGNNAFYGCSSLTSINIPDGVTSIGVRSFNGCSSLTSITIPDGVTEIGESTLDMCSSLTSITIPDGVTSIGVRSFYGCSSLTSINIPDGVTSIGESAFRGCSSLTSINIPDGVTSIGNYAFERCSLLENVTISSQSALTSIGDYTFSNCSSLTSITLPDALTSIGHDAFERCSSLTSITIPEGVTLIGGRSFYNCSSLTSITLPNSVTGIDYYAFYGCSSLTSINIPDGVTSIDNNAFECCFLLENVTISSQSALTSIGNAAFINCSSLTNINIPDGVTEIGENAFTGCSSLTNINIPDGVTSIIRAFYGCSSLTSITLHDGITEIGDYTFYDCSSLSNVICNSLTPPTLGTSAFSGIASPSTLVIPTGCTTAYSESDWAQYFTTIEEK